MGAVPDTAMFGPTRTARQYPTVASQGAPELTWILDSDFTLINPYYLLFYRYF
jgi:hypothetical protein